MGNEQNRTESRLPRKASDGWERTSRSGSDALEGSVMPAIISTSPGKSSRFSGPKISRFSARHFAFGSPDDDIMPESSGRLAAGSRR